MFGHNADTMMDEARNYSMRIWVAIDTCLKFDDDIEDYQSYINECIAFRAAFLEAAQDMAKISA